MMQLDALVLYGPGDETREILFQSGSLNIITGESGTGKTSLVPIVRFLLGDDSPHAPIGPIQRTVRWYGLLAHVGATSFFIGRPAPPHGSTTHDVALLIGHSEIPALSEIQVNCSTTDLREYLGGLIGIEDNLNVPGVGQTRRPLAATFVHSLYYCFQGQGEIANPDILFHRQNREWQPQTIRDTLPYFLGAQGVDALRKREELTQERRRLKRLTSLLDTAILEREQGLGRVSALITEARAAGLLLEGDIPASWDSAVRLLELALASDTSGMTNLGEPSGVMDELLAERANLRRSNRELGEALRGLDEFAFVGDGYATELNEHRSRLASIGLISEEADDPACPLCNQEVRVGEAHTAIGRQLRTIEHQLESTNRDRPRIEGARQRIVEQRNEIRARLQDIDLSLDSISGTEALREAAGATWNAQSYAKGRIAQYLESAAITDDDQLAGLEADVARVSAIVEALTEELDPAALRSRVNSLLNIVSKRMTALARLLQLEHADSGARIDADRLTVVADTLDGPAYMNTGEIGSGMNWVGYHLAAYLALQDYFVRHRRPVPGFIIIDQPSQAFFPRDRLSGGDLDELTDADREHTRQLYKLMYDAVNDLQGGLQVIAFDHAEFLDDWFVESMVERWRDGNALIPAHWIEGLSD